MALVRLDDEKGTWYMAVFSLSFSLDMARISKEEIYLWMDELVAFRASSMLTWAPSLSVLIDP